MTPTQIQRVEDALLALEKNPTVGIVHQPLETFNFNHPMAQPVVPFKVI